MKKIETFKEKTCYKQRLLKVNSEIKFIHMFDLDLVKEIYSKLPTRLDNARKVLGRPLIYAEKILYTHLFNKEEVKKL